MCVWLIFHWKSVLGFWIHSAYHRDLVDKPRSGGRNWQNFCFEEIHDICLLGSVMSSQIFIFLNALNVCKTVQVFNKGHIAFPSVLEKYLKEGTKKLLHQYYLITRPKTLNLLYISVHGCV